MIVLPLWVAYNDSKLIYNARDSVHYDSLLLPYGGHKIRFLIFNDMEEK